MGSFPSKSPLSVDALAGCSAGLDPAADWAILGQICQQLLGVQLPVHGAGTLHPGPVMQHGRVCEHFTVHVPRTLFSCLVSGQLGIFNCESLQLYLKTVTDRRMCLDSYCWRLHMLLLGTSAP